MKTKILALTVSALALTACGGDKAQNTQQDAAAGNKASGSVELLNVSYDVARDFYKDYNPLFIKHYQSP